MKKLKKWELLEEKDISPSKWFPLFKDKIKLPNGKVVKDYYLSKLGDASIIVPLTADKEIIFVNQYKHGVGDLILELPAGRVGNNTPEQAAKRELEEETGYVAKELKFLGIVFLTPSKDTSKMNGFIATGLNGPVEQKLDDNEEIEVVRVPTKNLDQMIRKNKIIAADTLAFLSIARLKYPQFF